MNTDELNDLFGWESREGDGARDAETDAAIADVDIAEEESNEESADTAQGGAETPQESEETPTPAEDTPEPPKPQKPSKKPSAPTAEEWMLEMLLKEQYPDTLKAALAKGKTIRGAWNYVVSVMKNAYIAKNGRVNGGMCGDPDVVVGIAERYLREFEEGALEPEVSHTPKKPEPKPAPRPAPTPAKKVEKVAKKAAEDAKKAADAKAKKVADDMQMLFNL